LWLALDRILPGPPDGAAGAESEADAECRELRMLRIRLQMLEKRGKGGYS
jgi:hypothetical protein